MNIKSITSLNPTKFLKSASLILLAVLAINGAWSLLEENEVMPAGLLNGVLGVSEDAEKIGSGKIVSIDGDTITVQGNIATTYKIDGSKIKMTKGSNTEESVSISDIKLGDTVQVYGKVAKRPVSVSSINTTGPASIFQGLSGLNNLSENMTKNTLVGNVLEIKENSLIVKKQNTDDSYTVNVTDSTTFIKESRKVSISDVKKDDKVTIKGEIDNNSKTIIATNISIGNFASTPSGTPNFSNILKGIKTR